MGLFQNNSKPHTAEEYRKSAQAHLNAAKTMFLTFLKTGVIMVTGITVIIVLTLSWFVSNTSVTGSHTSISADDGKRYLLVTKASEQQGIYDNKDDNILLKKLSQFTSFVQGNTDSKYREFICGDKANNSVRAITSSHVKKQNQNVFRSDFIRPGAMVL